MTKKALALVIDSCADLPEKYTQHSFIRKIPLNITFSDGTTIQDGIDITSEEFYRKMLSEKELPVTSQPSPEQFLTVYKELLNEYETIISFHLAAVLSGTYNSAMLAKQMVDEKDQHRICVIDSKAVSLVQGLMTLDIVECIKRGDKAEHIVKIVEELQRSYSSLILPDTLENLKKGGRISHLSALFGGLLQIKPILTVGNQSDGKIHVFTKVRGKKKAIKNIISTIKENAFNIQDQTIGVVHSFIDKQKELEDLLNLIQKELKPKDIIVSIVGATVGTHLGVNGFGIMFKE